MTRLMYRRIADDLTGQLESGFIPHGTRLPTELEPRDRYGAARNTVRDAIRLHAAGQLPSSARACRRAAAASVGGVMPDPMYRQIADDLRRKIKSGEVPPGRRRMTPRRR
jgi:DNA-binding GntR family transcriptional regulator